MAQQQKKKSARAKRSRLGRGLSALVDTPVVVEGEVEQSSKSDKFGASSGSISVGPDKSGNDGGDVTNFNPELSQRPVVKDVADPIRSAVENKDIQQAEPGVSHGSVEQRGERVLALSLGVIGVNRDQPRSTIDEDALESLASSIRAHGVMQPIVVRNVLEKRDDGIEFELVAGERRWRAAQIAELDTIPAVVREIDDATSAQLALIENVQREDLNPVELAEGYRALSDRYGMTQEAIAKQVGVSRSSVTNMIRLLELPEQVRAMVASGVLSMGHGKALLSLKSEMKQRKFGALAIKDGWNVRQLERAIQDYQSLDIAEHRSSEVHNKFVFSPKPRSE